MSIIETAYGVGVAANLCTAIEALNVATAAYQTTGWDALKTQQARDVAQAEHDRAEHAIRVAYLAHEGLGKNDRERAANLALFLDDDQPLQRFRAALVKAQRECEGNERAHKNAYHEMESLRVAINGFAAVLGATK